MGIQNPGGVCALIAGTVLAIGMTTNIAKAQPLEPHASTIDVAVGSNAPLTALSVTSDSLNCSQGSIVVGKNGKLGFLAPVIGPNVLRGSSDSGSAVSWAVIPLDGISAEMLNAVTTCLAAR